MKQCEKIPNQQVQLDLAGTCSLIRNVMRKSFAKILSMMVFLPSVVLASVLRSRLRPFSEVLLRRMKRMGGPRMATRPIGYLRYISYKYLKI